MDDVENDYPNWTQAVCFFGKLCYMPLLSTFKVQSICMLAKDVC